MAKYNAYQQNYAAYETLVFEGLRGQPSAEQSATISKKYANSNLEQLIEAEESRKMKAIDRHQEEEFLKVAMNPSVMPVDESVKANARNSIMSPKRSSIFNLQMDRLRIDPTKSPDGDSLYDLLSGKKPDTDSQSGMSPLDRTRAESSLLMDQVPQSPPLKDIPVAPPEPACAVHDPDSLYSKLFTSILPLNAADRPCYEEEYSGLQAGVSSTSTIGSDVIAAPVRKPHVDTPFNAQFIGPLDPLAHAAGIDDDFAIYPAEEPSVFVETCCQLPATPPNEQIKLNSKRDDANGLDDYNEKELVELPPTFGPSQPLHRDSKMTGASGNAQANVVDYRAIFTKCYRNGRRKTRALLETENVLTKSDMVDDRVTAMARNIPFEPLVQEWFALASSFQEGALQNVDYESLIPLLYLGLEEVVLQAAKRGLIPLGDEPRDEADLIDDPDFNPMELLGVFLLRHNPLHDSSWESNQYVHSFRKVVRQMRNEVLLEQPLGDVGDLAKVLEKEKAPVSDSKTRGSILSSVLDQRTSKKSCLADGIWDTCEDPVVLLSSEARSTLLKIVARLSKENSETQELTVDIQLMTTLLLTYVEDIHSLEFATKDAVRKIVRSISSPSGESFLKEPEALKVLQRVIRMLKQTDLQLLLDYTTSFMQQTEDTRKMQVTNARLYELFEALDEIKTGYVSRPKVLGLLEKFYEEAPPDNKQTLHDPRKWPITSITDLAAENREPSLPSGSTPTIFDVDDYQSLMSDAVDTEVPVPQEVMNESEEPPIQLDHPFLQHIFRDYPASNSNGMVEVPEDDLPEAAANEAKALCQAEKLPSQDLALVCKVYESYKKLRSGKDRSDSRPKKVWSVHSAPFMETVLTKHQFAVIITNFLGEDFEDGVLDQLIEHLRSAYQETSDELIARLRQEQISTRSTRRKDDLEHAFETKDVAGKGSLEHSRFLKLWLLTTFPVKACDVRYVLKIFCYASENTTETFSKKDFVDFCLVLLEVYNIDVDAGCSQLREELCKSVQAEQVEQSRTVLRKSWLKGMAKTVATCGGDRDKLYEEVVSVLEKDAKIHFSNKVITASIALLEKNLSNFSQGLLQLRFVGTSSAERKFLSQKVIFPALNDIGFACVNSGKVQRIEKVSDCAFSLPIKADRRQGTNGSFVCYPLTDGRSRVFGVLNVDTLGNKTTMNFSLEETEFHESVLRAFCEGFLRLDLRRRTAEALAVGLPWFGKRVAIIVDAQLYFVEPDEEQECPCLRKVASSMGTGATVVHPRPPVCRKNDPGFNQRLVTCAVTAESIKEKVHNEKHLTSAIRDPENFSAIVLDITFGRTWPEGEVEKDVVNLLAVCQQTYDEMHKEEDPEEPIAKLVIEREVQHLQHRFIFGRLLLVECRQICSRIPATILAEVRAIAKPTSAHLKVVKAILTSLYPVESEKGEFEEWSKCKDCIRLDLLRLMSDHDPTSVLSETTFQTIYKSFHDVALMSEAEAAKAHPVFKFFHRWCAVCLQLSTSAEDVRKGKYSNDFHVVLKPTIADQSEQI